MKRMLRWLLIAAALVLAAIPAAAHLSGRGDMVLASVAVGLAALCSFLAYRAAVLFRRRIDEIGDGAPRARRESDPER